MDTKSQWEIDEYRRKWVDQIVASVLGQDRPSQSELESLIDSATREAADQAVAEGIYPADGEDRWRAASLGNGCSRQSSRSKISTGVSRGRARPTGVGGSGAIGNGSSKTLGLLNQMSGVYSALASDVPVSAQHVTGLVNRSTDEGVGWSCPLHVLLEDITARGGRF